MGKQETLETIWEVPDELGQGTWERIEPIILEEDPPKARGRKRSDPRQMLGNGSNLSSWRKTRPKPGGPQAL